MAISICVYYECNQVEDELAKKHESYCAHRIKVQLIWLHLILEGLALKEKDEVGARDQLDRAKHNPGDRVEVGCFLLIQIQVDDRAEAPCGNDTQKQGEDEKREATAPELRFVRLTKVTRLLPERMLHAYLFNLL